MITGYNNQAGTELDRLSHRHGGANAILPGRVGGRSDYSPSGWGTPDCKGLPAQTGILDFFYGTEESIQIKVENYAGGVHF